MISFVSLLVALSGVAWAARLAEDSVRSKQIKDGQVKTGDLGDGAVATVKLADGSVVTGKVADENLLGDDLADETVTGSKITDETITGAKVENDSLEGVDIEEASLAGVALTSGDDCCNLREETLALGTAFNASDPTTFVDLGLFEIRTSANAGEGDKFQVCKEFSSPGFVPGIVYAGGTRFSPSFNPESNSCQTFDTNGSSTSSTGDFEVLLPISVRIWGSRFSTDAAHLIVLEF